MPLLLYQRISCNNVCSFKPTTTDAYEARNGIRKVSNPVYNVHVELQYSPLV